MRPCEGISEISPTAQPSPSADRWPEETDREGEHESGQLPDPVMGFRSGQRVVIAKPKHSLSTLRSLMSAISHVGLGLAQQLAEQLNYASQAGCLDAVWYESGTDRDLR